MRSLTSNAITWTLLLALVLGVPGRGVWGGSGSCGDCAEGGCQTTTGAATCCSQHVATESTSRTPSNSSCCQSSGNCAITALAKVAEVRETLSEASHGICRCCLVRTGTSAVVTSKTTPAESVGLSAAVLSIPDYPAAEIAWHLGQEQTPHERDTSLNVLLCRWLI